MGLLTIDITPPKRSNFDRSLKKRTSMAPGLLYPVLWETCIPGDEIKLNIESMVKTNALQAPLMGTFKLQFDYYFVPWRFYIPEFQVNANLLTQYTNDLSSVKLPTFEWPSVRLDANFDEESSNGAFFNPEGYVLDSTTGVVIPWSYTNPPGSVFDYLGFPVGFQNLETFDRQFNALPLMSYIDIWRNYYMNPQENVHPWFGSDYGDGAGPGFVTNEAIDSVISQMRNVNGSDSSEFQSFIIDFAFMRGGVSANQNTYCGLLSRTHRPDFLCTILNSDYVNSLNQTTKINVNNGAVTVDQIRTGFKFYKSRVINVLTGGRLDEFVRGHFGIKTDLNSIVPELLGTTSTFINFEDVVSQSATDDEPLGSLAGRGVGYLDGRQHYFRPQEYGTLMVIASIQPVVDYFQGINPWLLDTDMNDIFLPSLDNIGFEDISRAELSVYPDLNASGTVDIATSQDTHAFFDTAVGKRPAWLKYHTNVNRLHGDFADQLRYWTLGRQFSFNTPAVSGTATNSVTFDPSAYIDPREFQYIFADPTDENFFVQMSFNMMWKRPMSKRLMPTL